MVHNMIVSKLCIRRMESRLDMGSLCREVDMVRWAKKRHFHIAQCTTLQSNWSSRSVAPLADMYLDRKRFT